MLAETIIVVCGMVAPVIIISMLVLAYDTGL